MELMDFANPGAPATLALQTADEMALSSGQTEALTAELGGMVDQFRSHELWSQIASAATTHRELDFVFSAGPAQLRGQIDLLFADADGAWRIVDYKSDRLGPSPTAEDVAAHSTHHELQMLIYALAAEKHLGSPPAEATLYYLRPGLTHTIPITPDSLHQAQDRLASLTESLIASRRSAQFAADTGAACGYCPYRTLCH
jgi:ATP-dependent exoDNAse (exonuclease V) beta subunit